MLYSEKPEKIELVAKISKSRRGNHDLRQLGRLVDPLWQSDIPNSLVEVVRNQQILSGNKTCFLG